MIRFGTIRFARRHFTVYGTMLNRTNVSNAIMHIIIRKTIRWIQVQKLHRLLKCDPFVSTLSTLCFCVTKRLKKLQQAVRTETTLEGFTIEIDFHEKTLLLSFMA